MNLVLSVTINFLRRKFGVLKSFMETSEQLHILPKVGTSGSMSANNVMCIEVIFSDL